MTADPSDEAAARVTAETADETDDLTGRLRAVRGVVFDMDGTLVLGDRRNHGLTPLPGALELTADLTARGLPWVTFTNGTARTPEAYAETLRRIGFDLPDDAMLTPATSAVDHFLAMGHRSALVLGGDGLKEPLRQAGIEIVEPKGKPEADAVLVGWYREFTMDDLEAACHAVFGGATLYSSSQSVFFASADGRALGTSRAICAMVSSVTGVTEQVVGKPSLTGLRCAARRLGVAPQHLAVVGDDPELEMAMARRAGAIGIAVTTGIHAANHFTTLSSEQRPHLTVEGVGGLITLLPAPRSHPTENGSVPT
ncbi:HAD-IIA family hydrolase [Streptomyces capitiformicae]|uniref:Acid sugar phosphatase n=1 Tax=Streptomyces capitiformicae TaxID=2014920 RepID=A0A919DIY1_9ACTN|nr:HAD-IIA family hydrolase [Streptomyces capitiformicae]GHE46286.1 acid sugar phosphatase [Streptomyces capitiformicae]